MKRLRRVLLLALGLFALCLGGLALLALRVSYPLTGAAPSANELRGVIHVHTTDSDGRGTEQDVARAAKESGLRFVVITDHNRETVPPPRYIDDVLIVHGVELSTPHGHLVALGMPRGLTATEREDAPIEQVKALGGQSYLAHPVQRRNPWRAWSDSSVPDGMELYSGDTMWRELLEHPARLMCVAAAMLSNRRHAAMSMVHSDSATEQRMLSGSGGRVALCAHDAHGRPPYGWVFPVMSMHLPGDSLPADPEQAARQILGAVHQGQALCVFDALGSAEGFTLEGLDSTRRARPGDRIVVRVPPVGNARHRVVVAGAGRLLDDGRTVEMEREGAVLLQVQLLAPGCPAGEVWRPWIVPSPWWVGPAGP